ncbi:MAG: hypothetical protein H8E98_08675 [Bacteroidetes bacterium]|nr:hypothetical protein [Bacteroidota bacterium]
MEKLDWNNFYILGAFDQYGESHLTTWSEDGTVKRAEAVITHKNRRVNAHDVPFWKAKVRPDVILNKIPVGVDAHELARELDGIFAFGWYFENGFERKI